MNLLRTIPLLLFTLVNCYLFSATIHVNQSATGANNGTSWANAYIELSDAITNAASGDAIWVAKGIYKPDWNGSIHTGDRNLSFSPPANVSLYGGFIGNETMASQRDWGINQSILSGDLNGDDVVTFPTFNNNTENSARIIFIANSSSGVILDGFIIENANNNISWGGTGLTSIAPNMVINNCIFRQNSGAATAESAAGRLTLENCLFYENECDWNAAIYTHDMGVTMTNCTVVNNSSSASSAGLRNFSYMQGCEIVNCIFWGNTGGASTTEENQINVNTDPNGLPVFENNIVQGYTGTLQDMGSATNSGSNPGFVNFSGADFHLNISSAAIDAGDWTYLSSTLDLDLLSRIANGQVDIGVYEKTIIPLPVELLSFTAECNDNNVELSWTTLTEINNDYFTIEKSENGQDFYSIADVDGHATSTNQNNYAWIDDGFVNEIIYYRLKQTDFNGKVEYHNVVATKCKDYSEISVYPNPVNNELNIALLSIDNEEYHIQVKDILGRIIVDQSITNTMGKHQINLSEINSTGVFFIIISDKMGELLFHKKLIKI